MSMLLTDADSYIANVMGGRNDTNMKARAREALSDALEELQLRNDWSFLLTDTAQTFTVAGCHTGGVLSATLQTTTTNGFASCLQGMTITGTGITAGTTVSAMIAGSTTTLTMSTQANIASGASITATFGGTIPIIAGTDSYLLPTRFWKPYSARYVSNSKQALTYVTQRELDMTAWDQTQQGFTDRYTIYNPTLFDASGTQQAKLKLFRVPAANDTLLLRYYRPFSMSGTYVDIQDEYLYTALLAAQVALIRTKNATDERLPSMVALKERRVTQMIANDRNEGGEDEQIGMHSLTELSWLNRGDPIWPRGDYGW